MHRENNPPAAKKPPHFILDWGGALYRWVEGRSQVVVPTPLQQRVLSLAHDSPLAGHLGPEKTLAQIMDLFY